MSQTPSERPKADQGPVYLAVETSCDETAAAVVAGGRQVLSSCLQTQIDTHRDFGGVVPEVAARQHLETVNSVVEKALEQSGLTYSQLDGIAYTQGPGLVGTLLAGATVARTLAWCFDRPLIAVDHLQAHICANFVDTTLAPPFVALLVSGGHTQLILVEAYDSFRLLGQTRDDAAGEAYDKVGRLLGLPYPGGPAIDKLAAQGNPQAFPFPEGVVDGYDFSFSGLKTAVLRTVEKLAKPLPQADLSASFQEAVTRVLVKKTLAAQRQLNAPAIALAGGVAANSALRRKLAEAAAVPVFVPPLGLCTDNAIMVAAAAHFCGKLVDMSSPVYSRQRVR